MFSFIEFTYGGLHSVATVSEADFKTCNVANVITLNSTGNTIIKLDRQQTYYFICGNAMHCQGGMQLTIKVGN